jgi:hypothetical protein
MCLIVDTNSKCKRASKKIKCYKVLDCYDSGYFTFFQGVLIRLGKRYNSELHINFSIISIGLHSFKEKDDAINFLKNEFSTYRGKVVIVECYIPQGAEYYQGMFNDIYQSFASTAIRYTENIIYSNK